MTYFYAGPILECNGRIRHVQKGIVSCRVYFRSIWTVVYQFWAHLIWRPNFFLKVNIDISCKCFFLAYQRSFQLLHKTLDILIWRSLRIYWRSLRISGNGRRRNLDKFSLVHSLQKNTALQINSTRGRKLDQLGFNLMRTCLTLGRSNDH